MNRFWPKRRHTSSVPSSPANDCGCACGKPGSCSSACSRHTLPYDHRNLHGRAGHPCLASEVDHAFHHALPYDHRSLHGRAGHPCLASEVDHAFHHALPLWASPCTCQELECELSW